MEAMLFKKLELQAALIAACLSEDIQKALTTEVVAMFKWSNSSTVLHGLSRMRSFPYLLQTA